MATLVFLIYQASCLWVVQPTAACEPGSCDASSILQVQAAGRTALTCAHGEEDYTLADWTLALYSEGDRPANGVTITSYEAPDPDCSQPGILMRATTTGTPVNNGILACDCRALVMVSQGDTYRNIWVCNADPASKISLQFDEPQDIVSVTFQSVEEGGNTFTYTTVSPPFPSIETVSMPINGRGVASTVDLSLRERPAQSVRDVEIELFGRTGFIGMKLCKGAGSLVGDPHIRTQDHAHYTVLNEGNFLAWRFHSETQFASKTGLKKAEVDWRIYTHYSAHRNAWTRGLLLVDKSGSERQSLELTSEACKLRKGINGTWSTMNSSELLHVPEEGVFLTGFNLTELGRQKIDFEFKVRTPKGMKARWDGQLLMATPRGPQAIATVQLRCFPGRHIDLQVVRERMGDARFVEGQLSHHEVELKREKNGLGNWFRTSEDTQFRMQASWKDLGGSLEAANYLEMEDVNAKQVLTEMPGCSPEQRRQAMVLCKATMESSRNIDAEFLDDCILDVCAGGEEAAELARDILSE